MSDPRDTCEHAWVTLNGGPVERCLTCDARRIGENPPAHTFRPTKPRKKNP